MKRIKVLLAALLFINISTFSQTNNKLLNAVQEKYNSLSSISAHFIQSIGGKSSVPGKIYYGKGNKFRIELKNNLIICNGETLWNFSKKQNKVVINKYDPEDPSSLSIDAILFDYPAKCTSVVENGVIILTPKEGSNLEFSKAELWVNDSDLIEKVLIEDPNQGTIEVSLSNYNLDQKFSQSEFTFTPPEGSKIIDLR